MILKKIEKTAKENPEMIAMISEDSTLTYGELWEKSGILGGILEAKLGKDKTPIPVYGHKSPLMLISFLACVRTGRAYVPNDTSMPTERVADIFDMVGSKVAISAGEIEGAEEARKFLASKKQEDILEIVDVEEVLKSVNACKCADDLAVGPEDTFYIIFTSGSTGKPKGVEISHRALSNFAEWMAELTGAKETRGIFLNQAPFSFDLSVLDLYTALSTGGTLFCLTKKAQQDMSEMYRLLGESNIRYWVSTPSFADMCLADRKFTAELMTNLEKFIFCGEKLTKKTVRKLKSRFEDAVIVNTYGPTESTVAVTSVVVTDEMIESEKDIPIGVAKPGTEIIIEPEMGEILIKGDTVAKGYYRDEEKTAKAFVVSDACRDEKNETVCYKTGDAGYFENGMLYYSGRIDLQIKLHGYRIELGDIESNLIGIEGVDAAAAIAKKDAEGKAKFIEAFAVCSGKFTDKKDQRQEMKRIKGELRKILPAYMVPKKINIVESLPVTANGKIDRRKLEEKG